MYAKKPGNFFVSTLSIKIFFLILVFVGIPYILVLLLNRYQQKAGGILDQETAVVEIQTEKEKELKVLTQAEANTLSQINSFIGGTWVSETDGRYKIQVDLNNKFEEYYDDTKEGFGVWRVFSGTKADVDLSSSPEIADESLEEDSEGANTSTSDQFQNTEYTGPSAYTKSQYENPAEEDSKFFFQKQQYEPEHKGEKYVYQIQQLDTEKFVLVYKGGKGRPLVFVRSTSTASIFDYTR